MADSDLIVGTIESVLYSPKSMAPNFHAVLKVDGTSSNATQSNNDGSQRLSLLWQDRYDIYGIKPNVRIAVEIENVREHKNSLFSDRPVVLNPKWKLV